MSQIPASKFLLYLHLTWPLLLLTDIKGIKPKIKNKSLGQSTCWHWFAGSVVDRVHASFSVLVQDLTPSAFNDKLFVKSLLCLRTESSLFVPRCYYRSRLFFFFQPLKPLSFKCIGHDPDVILIILPGHTEATWFYFTH